MPEIACQREYISMPEMAGGLPVHGFFTTNYQRQCFPNCRGQPTDGSCHQSHGLQVAFLNEIKLHRRKWNRKQQNLSHLIGVSIVKRRPVCLCVSVCVVGLCKKKIN